MKNLFFWLSVVVMSLLVMQSANAEVEQVLPLSGGYVWTVYGAPSTQGGTPEPPCWSKSNYQGFALPNYRSYAPLFVSSTRYQCRYQNVNNLNVGASGFVDRSGITPVCPSFSPEFLFNVLTGFCERELPACPSAGTVASSGYYDRGANYDALPPGIVSGCFNNCGTTHQFIDPPSYRAKISGVYHYYSKGALVYDGGSCVAGSPATSATVDPTTVQQSCASGEVGVTSSAGVLNCYKDGSISGASAPVATTTSTSTTITTDPVTGASSVSVSTTIAETTGGSTGGTSGTPGVPEDLQDFCKSNPTSPMCKPSDEYELGVAPAAETLPSDQPVFSVSTVSFASVAGCPAPVSFEITGLPMISKSYSISWQPFCDVAAMLRPIFLAIAAITAAFIFAGVMI